MASPPLYPVVLGTEEWGSWNCYDARPHSWAFDQPIWWQKKPWLKTITRLRTKTHRKISLRDCKISLSCSKIANFQKQETEKVKRFRVHFARYVRTCIIKDQTGVPKIKITDLEKSCSKIAVLQDTDHFFLATSAERTRTQRFLASRLQDFKKSKGKAWFFKETWLPNAKRITMRNGTFKFYRPLALRIYVLVSWVPS